MYTQQDLNAINQQLKKRLLLLMIPIVLLLAPFLSGIILHLNRQTQFQWLTYVSGVLLGIVLLFCDGLFISPLRAYRRHLKNMLFGRTREMTCYFKSIDETVCIRDNVAYYPMIASENDLGDEEDDRLFYLDTLIPLPELSVGDKINITSHDKSIANIKRL